MGSFVGTGRVMYGMMSSHSLPKHVSPYLQTPSIATRLDTSTLNDNETITLEKYQEDWVDLHDKMLDHCARYPNW